MLKIKLILLIFLLVGIPTFPVIAENNDISSYVIGADDVLELTILGKGDYKLTEEKTVSSTGRILLSITQEEFTIAGMTVADATKKLEQFLAEDYLRDPRVIISIKVFNSQKILLIGEVKKPGEIILKTPTMSLKDLIIEAGGPRGDMEKTVILVNDEMKPGTHPTAVSLDELLLSNQYDLMQVKSGDIIYVLGRDKQLPIPDLGNTVYIFGQVTKPGIVPYSRNMTVLRAIIGAGNFTKEASPGRTTVKRKDGHKIRTIKVDLEKMMSGGDKSQDIELKPGDVIYAPRAIF